jgi:hypothetical protein
MGLHHPDDSFGMVEIDELTCSFCEREPIAVIIEPNPGRPLPVVVWVCEDHAPVLSTAGHYLWAIRRTCQEVDDDVPCGRAAHWLAILSTEGKVQPGSLCREHAEPRLEEE